MTAGSGSGAERMISLAAQRLGIDDPIVIAGELQAVDVDGLDQWFNQAARIAVQLFQGADRLSEVDPLLAAGWSNPAARVAVVDQREAAMASREVVGTQVSAADQAGSVLRHTRFLVEGELTSANAALIGVGWPPGQDLFSWAVDNGKLEPVTATISGLTGRVTELRTRNEQALADLALALRADPRDSTESLAAETAIGGYSAAVGGYGAGTTAGIDRPGMGSADIGQVKGVDQANLDRLAIDLQSTEVATQLMALGVRTALQKAAAGGDVAQLLVYESANSASQGRAAIGIGDISTADNVAVLVPGIGNAPVNMADGIGNAAALRDAAGQRAAGDKSTVVAWYGYDMPLGAMRGTPEDPLSVIDNMTAVVDDANAEEGAQRLTTDLGQFREWAPESARFVAAGFSMGSTTVSAAAARGAKLDDVLIMASPGAGDVVDSVADYPQVPDRHVWVTSFADDPITTSAADVIATVLGNLIHPFSPSLPDFTPFGPDPADSEFGGQLIDVQSNNPDISVGLGTGPFGPITDAITNELLDLQGNHQESNYYSGASLDAAAAVVTGQYGDIPIKPGR
jgi:hypothetical protein